jgi:prophage DNA circulation protein
MSWRDRLTKASFRDVEFLTESHEAKFGRRLVVHEFPGADVPLIEDLGTKSSDLHINAYFIGADYDLARNHFLLLLQKSGAAWLNHPWLGRLEVRAKDWTLSESNDKCGYCTVAIDFVPAGLVITQAMVDKADQAAAKLKTLSDTTQSAFSLSIMSSDALQKFIAKASSKLDGLRNVLSIATLPLTYIQQVTGTIQGIKNDFASLLSAPNSYVITLRSLYDSILSIDGGVIVSGSATVLVDSADIISGSLTDNDRPRVIAHLTQLATSEAINKALLNRTVSATSALELPVNIEKDKAFHALFLISVAGQLALADYLSRESRDFSLNAVIAAIDAILPVLPDDVFQAAVSARVAVIEALNAQDLEPTQEREVFDAMPATVLAHRFELDESVFNAINAVRHPLFVHGVIYD